MFSFGWELGSDSSSENSDHGPDAYKWKAFVVVKAHVNNKDRYDCIPRSWLVFDKESGRGYQTTVTYRFPSADKLGKGIEFRTKQKSKISWPKYNGKVLLDTDSKEQAFRLIKNEKEKSKKILKEAGDSHSSTSKLDSHEEDNSPKSGTKRKQTEQENKNIPAKTIKVADESENKIVSEKIELPKELHVHCKKFYDELNATYQKSMSILDNTAEYLQKIISTHKAKLSTPLSTSQKLDDTTGTKWTLRHHEPSPGIVELVPNTGVYVSEEGLNACKINCTASTEFTRAVLAEVFTDEALRKCSYTGQPPRSDRDSGNPTKPALDLNARQTLVDYCLKYSGEKGWCYGQTVKEDTDRIINSIKGRLYELYKKSQ